MLLWLLVSLALAAEPTLPQLERSVPAVYPADALASGTDAQVLLQLDVDAQGNVLSATVLESAGPEFDAAARAAVLDFAFIPATDAQGRPAPARITYRYVFTADTAPLLSAEGQVLDPSDVPLTDVLVTATGPDGTTRTAITDDTGSFALAGLADGDWTLVVSPPGRVEEQATVTVRSGRVSEVVFRPAVVVTETDEDVDMVIAVERPRRPPEINERALTQDEIRYLPGSAGDVVRAVQNLPGIARPPLNIGQLIVRGTAPEESAYFVDGVRVPIVFHFAGLSTVVAGDSLEEVTFFPGNFGPRYGNILGGGVDLRFDDDIPDVTNGFASIDVYQATLFHEQRLGENTALTVSGRRSWIDAILGPILASSETAIQAPRYYDGQLRLVHRTPSGGTLDALVFFSDDRFSIVGSDEDNPFSISLVTTFQKARLSYRGTTRNGWQSETTLLAGPDQQAFDVGADGEAYERGLSVGLRHEVSGPLGDRGRMVLGFDGTVRRDDLLYDVDAFGPTEQVTTWRVNPALYAEPTLALGRLRVSPGVRFDPLVQSDGYGTVAVDPRLGLRYDAGDSALSASTGRYSQFPTARQVAEQGASSPLGPATSWQSSVGIDQRIGALLTLDASLFYNRLTNLVVGREDTFRFFTGPPPIGPFDIAPYANDGTGDIVGAEVQLRLQTERSQAWLTATFSRSTRTKRPDTERRLFTYDQPVVLNALATTELGRGWRLGGRVRFGSGNPYTPVVNRIYSLDKREFTPVYGPADSARLPSFFSLDVRVDKQWEFKRFDLSVYLDLQNATNAQNPEVTAWTYDYAEEDPITSLPVLPILGLRTDW